MAKTDIVARLQLRAEQFDSELGKSMANADKLTRSAASQVRSTWATTFAETQKLAGVAITMPRTSSGSLNLSAEIASLKEAAAESDRHAQALREMSIAQTAAAASGKVDAAALKAEADASAVGALAHEREAAGLRDRIEALRIVQGELNKTTSQIEIHDAAGKRLTISAGQQRQAMQQLGYQVNDVATQYASGTPVLQIFAQQSGQVIQVVQSMTTKTTGLLGVLGGPWGAVIGAAAIVLIPYVGKLIEGNSALDDAVDKLKEEAAQSEVTRQARELFGRSEAGVTAAIRESYDASQKLVGVQRTTTEQTLVDARANLATALSIRQKTDAELAWAQALLESAKARSAQGGERGEVATMFLTKYEARLADIQKRRLENSIAIGQAEATINNALIAQERAQAKLMQDPIARVTAEWDAKIAALDDEAKRQGRITAEYRARSRELERQKKLAVDTEQERQNAANRRAKSDPDTASVASVSALLRRELSGIRITSTTGGKHVAGSDHYGGNAIDFVPKGGMGSMSKADVRALFDRAGIPIRRNAAGVEQLFGPGDKGHSDHFHVAWEKGKLALDNYRASQKDAATAARELKQEQAALERALDDILKALDPLAAATARYTDRLADLAKLQASGRITLDQQLDYGRDAQKELGEARAKVANDNFRDIFGGAQIDETLREFDANIANAADTWGEGLRDGAEDATDLLRESCGEIASMFGLRISGPLGSLLNGRTRGLDDKQAAQITRGLTDLGVKLPKEFGKQLQSGTQGAMLAMAAGQLGSGAGKTLGLRQSSTGAALGSLVGAMTPLGPVGAAIGGLLGGTVGGLLAKTKKGSSTITFGADGLGAGGAVGNSSAAKAAAAAGANSVVGTLNRIAEALGGEITGAGSVSIGKRKDKFVVDTSGRGKTKGAGVLSFDSEEAAIRAAIAETLRDGVVGGITDASKRILAAGSDLEKAITKASLIEAVPKDLKAMLDPLAAAIDELNRKFQKTVEAMKEGGATAEQLADAQKLYDLQLAQVKASTAAASADLKAFLKSLTLGADSPLSLRDREAAALADLKPFLTQIDAGQSIDQSKYQEAARAYLDIERELYGSTAKFFEAFDAVQASTGKAIATIDNAVPVAGGVSSPFAKETAASAATTAANTATGNAIADGHTDLLLRIAQAVEGLGGEIGDTNSFIGSGRLFANQAR